MLYSGSMEMPTPQWQQQEEEDNCFYACLATLLGISQSDIPFGGKYKLDDQFEEVNSWCNTLGFHLRSKTSSRLPVNWPLMRAPKRPYIGCLLPYPINPLVRQPQGHAVIMEKNDILFDPSPTPWSLSNPKKHRAMIMEVCIL